MELTEDDNHPDPDAIEEYVEFDEDGSAHEGEDDLLALKSVALSKAFAESVHVLFYLTPL